MDPTQTIIATTSLGMTAGLAVSYALNRWMRGRADAAALEEAIEAQRDVPRSLYPLVDTDRCIGSLACLRSCPEGDVLGLVDGVAKLVRGGECIGHGRCADECPVSAITLVFGTAKRGIDLPEVSATFESSRPGVHIIGELAGMGLIKNAMRQGLELAGHLARTSQPPAGDLVDVCIVGAGPAGLTAALALTHHGVSFRLLEQDALGGTVAHYPRQKVVMTEPIRLPIWGKFGKRRIYKEELLELFERIVHKARIPVEQGVRVLAVDGEDGDFTVRTSQGTVRARKVVLAIGRRGTPRKLGVPGEEQSKVVYRLDSPEQYDGARVLVVGAGDAGVEAAWQLARESTAAVWLSYRGPSPKCREPNRVILTEQAQRGRVTLLPSSQVKQIGANEVALEVDGAPTVIPNDFVIVSVGGELPAEFLEKAGVGMRRYHAQPPGDPATATRRHRDRERALRKKELQIGLALTLVAAAGLAVVTWRGWSYYVLPAEERLRSPLHSLFRPAGSWGHWLGIVATALMLVTVAYAVRKRVDRLSTLGDIRTWLLVHVFAGFAGPALVAYHAVFHAHNLMGVSLSAAIALVMVTGVVGRYLFGLVPVDGGRSLELEELQRRFVRSRTELEPMLRRIPDPGPVKRLFKSVTGPLPSRSFLVALAVFPLRTLRSRALLHRFAALFPDRESRMAFRDDLLRCERLRLQIGFHRSLKAFMRSWRIIHATIAVFLVVAIAAHIGFALYLGYGLK